MTKLRFTTQETREEPFAPSFYRADQHAARPGAWHVTVAGRDYEVETLLETTDTAELASLFDAIADAVVLLMSEGAAKIEPVEKTGGGGR